LSERYRQTKRFFWESNSWLKNRGFMENQSLSDSP
jgi:hypothetical protein